MTKRSVVVELMARVGQYVSGMGTAAGATDKLARAQDQAGRAHEKAAQQSQKAAAGVSAAMAKEAQAAKDSANAKGLAYNADGKLVDSSGKVATAAKAAEAGLDQYSDAVKQAAQATESVNAPLQKADSTLQQVAKSAKENREAWDQAGTALTGFGAITVGALGATAKAAMDWESAWAGVTKTVDGTPAQMADMEQGLRNLAKTLPLAHGEIAAVAEAAGQLGVAREDVLGFTKTMINLGESTNLTADEAATQIAQISNVMGTMAREGSEGVARFGATLVELGNNGASTEADILAMSQRIAGAMATVGGSEVEVLALSNALASMGVKAELGGGVATRVLLKMYSAIADGGPKLEAFASTAGVSAAEFSAAFEESPVRALSMVTEGLGRVKDEGGNVVATLGDMGLKGTENTQVMLALASSGTLLADGLEQGNQAWKENTALIEEASKRYETTESKVKIAWNGIKDAAIDAGAVVLPMIVQVSDTVSTLAGAFGDLPAPVQGALTGLAGVAGGAALLTGGLLLLVPRAMDTVQAFKTLKTDMPGVSTGLGRVAKAAGLASAAFVGFEIVKNIHNDMQPATASVEEMTQALIGLGDQKDSVNDVFANIDFGEGDRLQGQIDGVGDALGRLTKQDFWDAGASFGDTVLGIDNGMSKLRETVEQLDQSIASAASSGNMDLATEGFKSVADAAADQGVTLEDVAARFPAYMDALRASANAAGVTVTEQELLNWAMGETPAKMQEAEAAARKEAGAVDEAAAAAEAAAVASEELIEALAEIGLSAEGTIIDLQKFTDMLFSMGLATMSSREAAFTWEETLRGMGAAAQEVINSQATLGPLLNATGTDFNTMTDSGKAANEMLQGIITEGLNVASTFSGDLSKSAADVSAQLKSTYDAGVQSAMGLGLGEDAAIALTRELMGIPPGVSVETWMSDAAEMRADTTGEAIGEIPDSVHVQTSMDMAAFETAGMTKKAADDIPNQETIDSWMSDAAFIEAVRTRAAALGIPEHEAISSFMSSAARNEADATTSQILKIPPGASISSYMDAYARIEAQNLNAELDRANGRVVTSYMDVITRRSAIDLGSAPAGTTILPGQVGRRASGGRLPKSGPGTHRTDGILGVSSLTGAPTTWVDAGEWVVNAKMSDKHDRLIAAINRDDPRLSSIPGLAGGGRASREYPAGQLCGSGRAGSSETHHHYHIDSKPGLAHRYAQDIAAQTEQRVRDAQHAYGI